MRIKQTWNKSKLNVVAQWASRAEVTREVRDIAATKQVEYELAHWVDDEPSGQGIRKYLLVELVGFQVVNVSLGYQLCVVK